jgi:hypothetical protein
MVHLLVLSVDYFYYAYYQSQGKPTQRNQPATASDLTQLSFRADSYLAFVDGLLYWSHFHRIGSELSSRATLPLSGNDLLTAKAWKQHSSGDDPGAMCSRAGTNDDYSRPSLLGDCYASFLLWQHGRIWKLKNSDIV